METTGGGPGDSSTNGDSSGGVPEEDIAVTHGPRRWHLLKSALTLEEQVRLFDSINEHDATDWEKLSPCMNPTPKTLQLVQHRGAQPAPTLSYGLNDRTAVVEMAVKAIRILRWHQAIKSMTVAAIRYCASGSNQCIGGCFPPHIDHCNDGSWVMLFSLGRTVTFHLQTPGMTRRHTFEMKSGDALVFDPSSEAAIVHGVIGIACAEEEASARGDELEALVEKFDVLRSSRFGIQCRVLLS